MNIEGSYTDKKGVHKIGYGEKITHKKLKWEITNGYHLSYGTVHFDRTKALRNGNKIVIIARYKKSSDTVILNIAIPTKIEFYGPVQRFQSGEFKSFKGSMHFSNGTFQEIEDNLSLNMMLEFTTPTGVSQAFGRIKFPSDRYFSSSKIRVCVKGVANCCEEVTIAPAYNGKLEINGAGSTGEQGYKGRIGSEGASGETGGTGLTGQAGAEVVLNIKMRPDSIFEVRIKKNNDPEQLQYVDFVGGANIIVNLAGGAGGKGGEGGKGGHGTDGPEPGLGGTGGTGGEGGQGGNGGSLTIYTDSAGYKFLAQIKLNNEGGAGGPGGEGGKAGKGGTKENASLAGSIITGRKGDEGRAGSNGSRGSYGPDRKVMIKN